LTRPQGARGCAPPRAAAEAGLLDRPARAGS
jgi:hypothetical protein